MGKEYKINLTSIIDDDKSVLQTQATLERIDNQFICVYQDKRSTPITDVKMVLTKDEAMISKTRGKEINKMYFKKGNVYQGKYYLEDAIMDLKVETLDYKMDGLKVFIKYVVYLNNVLTGHFEHYFEFKEKNNNEC